MNKVNLLKGMAVATFIVFIAATVSATTITTYTGFSDWETAVGTYELEDFSDNLLVDGLSFVSTSDGEVDTGGYFYDRPTANNGGTTWSFNSDVFAFGGLWDLAGPNSKGMGLLLTMTDGATTFLAPEISRNTSNTFWGFTSDMSFTSVSVAAGTQSGIAETYHVDNLVFAETSSPVPEPATMILFGAGILGLAGSRLRRKK